MSVYVDNARISYSRMKMCHMLADTDEELHAMADRIGISRRWHQKPGSYRSHYDISLVKRQAAIEAGAVEITRRQLGEFLLRKREGDQAA